MKISDAVRKAVDLGDGDQWRDTLPAPLFIAFTGPWLGTTPDAYIFRTLVRGYPCQRARRTHVERADGTLQPWLILTADDLERRAGFSR